LLTRRTFISWLGAIASTLGLRGRSIAALVSPSRGSQVTPLDPVLVTRLGEAVLPGELGEAGTARVARAFVQWLAAYRAGAEQVHPYGSADLRYTGASPAARWRDQLDELDRAARRDHGRSFASLTTAERRGLVAAALAGDRSGRLPDPIAARHVAVGLLAWFYASPDATNLCYRRRIDADSCRPLMASPREPLPLADAGQGVPGGWQSSPTMDRGS